LRLVPVLAALACLTRLPSFRYPLWNPDEGYLAVQAGILAHGGELYRTVVDRKPPLVPWLYQVAFTVFGDDSLLPLKVLAVAAQCLTAVFLAALARRRWGGGAGRTAGVLYLLASIGLSPEDAQAAGFEVFMLPCTAAAMWCADRRRWGAAGTAIACAFLTKQTGAAVLVPVAWLWWRAGAPRGGLGCAIAGGTVPLLVVALGTDPGGFLFWTVTGSGSYAALSGTAVHLVQRALGNAALLTLGCGGIVAAVLKAPASRLSSRRKEGLGGGVRLARAGRRGSVPAGTPRAGAADLWLWLGCSALAVLAGFHFFGHYYLQLVPALALLGTAVLHRAPAARTAMACAVSACCAALFLIWGLLVPRPELAHAQRLAAAVAARTAVSDRVLLWGMHPEGYWLAGRAPASRFLTAGLLTNYSGGRSGGAVGEEYAVSGSWPVFRAELAAHRPALIVDDSRGKPYAPGRLPPLRHLLATRYEPVLRVDGAVLYGRVHGRR
jgi:hypothetical protein